jgi:hypothetical protein
MFIIVDTSNLFPRPAWMQGELIPEDQRPTFVHRNRDSAESELLRLQGLNPLGEYRLFEAIAYAPPTLSDRRVFIVTSVPGASAL